MIGVGRVRDGQDKENPKKENETKDLQHLRQNSEEHQTSDQTFGREARRPREVLRMHHLQWGLGQKGRHTTPHEQNPPEGPEKA